MGQKFDLIVDPDNTPCIAGPYVLLVDVPRLVVEKAVRVSQPGYSAEKHNTRTKSLTEILSRSKSLDLKPLLHPLGEEGIILTLLQRASILVMP